MGNLEKAEQILANVKGCNLDQNKKEELTIELAALILKEADLEMSDEEKKYQVQLFRLMNDPIGKAFTMVLTDQCFRSKSNKRNADQLHYQINQMGIPTYLNFFERASFYLFKILSPKVVAFFIPYIMKLLRRETSKVILPGEYLVLNKHILKRKAEGVKVNLNHLGEAILSESEAEKRLNTYLLDLENPNIDYVSIKISTLYSQINLLAYEDTINVIAEKLRRLYRKAIQESHRGKQKFVNLDMEEYQDLNITIEVFKQILSEQEFLHFSAGIVLQAYLPESHFYQKELTHFAKERLLKGGAPIKIRIVKGANLAMEQFLASLKGWPQAPYNKKIDVDANFKKMVLFGLKKENAISVKLGIASHNIFDIAFAMITRSQNEVESFCGFEMLEGMADSIRKVVQKLTKDMLLYCPVATKEEFQHAVAYLVRRLDENTGPENFLRYAFNLHPGSKAWNKQAELFKKSYEALEITYESSRKNQNRKLTLQMKHSDLAFENEADTDFSLPQNRSWAQEIADHYKNKIIELLPLSIGGKDIIYNINGIGTSPTNSKPIYNYAIASHDDLNTATKEAKSYEKIWASHPINYRVDLIKEVAQKLREKRGELIGTMMLDTGKTVFEADPEVSEAIDFAEYYCREYEKMMAHEELIINPKGTCLVVSPWNFPCSIPAGGIIAALITGNSVLFKPATNATLVGHLLASCFWQAGIPKEVLQFIPCKGDEIGENLIKNPLVDLVILTGGTSTAKNFLEMRPNLDLAAETGGKNAIIITATADLDLAIKELLQSAFGHAGQKCSAASLAILEKEVYDDKHFLNHLKEATLSMKVGSCFELKTKINSLISEPQGALKRGLTTLEDGEEWLVEPTVDPNNNCIWTPGIKLGVKPGSFTHMTELFGPVLALMRAENLQDAIDIANQVPYGLTSGLHTLDEREKKIWIEKIEAGNLYINRGITGAIVQRQPFGGCKASSVGSGSKAGGPNYLRQCVHIYQKTLPTNDSLPLNITQLILDLTDLSKLPSYDKQILKASFLSYEKTWENFKYPQDESKIVGQDNFLIYRPRNQMSLRIGSKSKIVDVLRVIAAAIIVGLKLEISQSVETPIHLPDNISKLFKVLKETDNQFCNRIENGQIKRIRMVEKPSLEIFKVAAKSITSIIHEPVLATGRYELLHYLQEIALSHDYHRYGNLGLREKEKRKPIL